MPNARLLVFVGLLLALAATHASAAEWWEKAADKTQTEFNAVKGTVDQTVDVLEKTRDELWRFEEWARQNLTGEKRRQALEKIRQARQALEKHTEPLKLFKSHIGKVTSAVDGLMELKALAAAAKARQGGQLAAALHVVSNIMENYGAKVPIIGKAIEVYGKLTTGILDATDRIARTIKENRNQGMLGEGTYGMKDDPRWQALAKKYPDLAKKGHTYAPADVPYVYAPIGQSPDWCLIWDPAAKEWYKVNQSAAVVEGIYRDRLIAKGHPQPWDLVVLSRHYDALEKRRQAARQAMDIWRRASNFLIGAVPDAFEAVNSRHDYQLSLLMRDPEAFVAKYSQDVDFQRRVNKYMAEFYAEILARGGKAPAIEKWAKAHNVSLTAGAKPSAPQQVGQAGQAGQPQTGSGTAAQSSGGAAPEQGQQPPSGPVKLSLVFLVDCSGSMAGPKIEAAKRAVAASVARTNDGHTEWALLAFGACRVREIIGFTRDPAAVTAAAQSLTTGGDTPLTYATYKAIAYLARNGHGQQGRLVVLCDGQDNCPERGSTSRDEAMAGLRTLVRTVTPNAAAAQGGGQR